MRNYSIITILLSLCILGLPMTSQATPAKKTIQSNAPFSPYADLTINAHWDANYQDMEPMDLLAISQTSHITNYHLAFITDAGNCQPAWGAQSTYSTQSAWGKHLTDNLLKNNIKFTISFGGATGNDLSMGCTTSQLINTYEQIITTYQPEGLDFDIENGTANVPNVMLALQTIQKAHPKLKLSFTLPVLPEGLTYQGQDIVKQAQANGLDFAVNIMAMDYGPAYTGNMGEYAITAATNLFLFLQQLYPQQTDAALWQKVQVTPMIGVNDVNIEQFLLTDADKLAAFAKQQQLGLLSMWSVARDNPCADKWASPTCSGNNLQSHPYEYAEHFLQQ